MWTQITKLSLKLLLITLTGELLFINHITMAASTTYSSNSYGINSYSMNPGSSIGATSPSYQANASLGDLGAGNASSPNYQIYAGSTTTSAPYLEFTVNNSNVNLGILSSSSTATTNATFSVRDYLSSGYVVLNASAPPSEGSGSSFHQLINLTSPTLSQTGQEQFGINLVANTQPTTFGANPSQVPNSSYSYGQVESGYNTPNYYKYINGDTIAYSNSSSGTTTFTISYIFNISPITPAGIYNFNHILVCLPTF